MRTYEQLVQEVEELRRLLVEARGESFRARASEGQLDASEKPLAPKLSETEFALAFANSPAAIALTRLDDGVFLEVNDSWVALMGYARGEAIGASARSLPIWPNHQARDRFVSELREFRVVRWQEQEFRKKRGEVFVAQLAAQLLTMGDSEVILSTLIDVSERKAAEISVRRALLDAQRFRDALERVSAFVYMKDLDFRYIYGNRLTLDLFGCSAEEIVGLGDETFFPPETVARLREVDARVFSGQQTFEEISVPDGKGGQRTYLEVKTPIYAELERRNVCGLLGISTEITDRKATELALEAARAAAEAANQAKSEFLATMSHEIRTPLNAIMGFSELFLLPGFSLEDRKEFAESVLRNGALLVRLIEDILDFSKIEAGKMQLERIEVCLPDLIGDIDILMRQRAREKGLEFRWNTEGQLPDVIVSDPVRLRQILLNIVGNAIKFTARGSVTVDFKVDVGQRTIHARVADTGIGLTDEQAARLFQPFVQADLSTTRKYGGTGLGLVLSRRIAKALGGDIVILESRPGRGCTFGIMVVFELPGDGARFE